MKNVIPIVMAGVIGIYGLIVSVILAQSISTPSNDRVNSYSIYTAMAHVSSNSALVHASFKNAVHHSLICAS
jgi:V-type H+-transporting ATPase proteolipid subunit